MAVLLEMSIAEARRAGFNIGQRPWNDEIDAWINDTGIELLVDVVYHPHETIKTFIGYDHHGPTYREHPTGAVRAKGILICFASDADLLHFHMRFFDVLPVPLRVA